MIKGNQKKVIHIKNTESCIFDEAYFILKEGIFLSDPENDMILEANRIIEENSKSETVGEGKNKFFLKKEKLFLLITTAVAVFAVLLLHLFFF